MCSKTMIVCCIWFFSVVLGASASPLHMDSSCGHVRQLYPKPTHILESSAAIKGICPHASTGCCRGLDSAIEHRTRQEFSTQLLSSNLLHSFKHHFVQSEMRIYNKLEIVINQTLVQLHPAQVEGNRVYQANKNLLDYVKRLIYEGHNKEKRNRIDHYVDRLLEAIFISELQKFHRKVHPSNYVVCLLNVMKDNDILADIRYTMIRRFHRAIETASLILQSLELSSNLLNQSAQIKLDEQCVRQLASTFHCSRCSDHNQEVRPCASTCRNAIAVCVGSSQLSSIDKAWRSIVKSFDQLVTSMVDYHNPETVFAGHNELLAKARHSMMSNNDTILREARVACGLPRRYSRGINIENTYDYYNYSKPHEDGFSQDFSLFVSMQSMFHLLSQNKDIFANLPHKMCHKHTDSHCWDGRATVSSFKSHHKPQPLAINHTTNHFLEPFKGQLERLIVAIDLLSNNRLNRSNQTFSQSEDAEDHYLNLSRKDSLDEGSGSGHASDDDEDYQYRESSGDDTDDAIEIDPTTPQGSEDIMFESNEDSQPTDQIVGNEIDATQHSDPGSASWSLEASNSVILCLLLVHLRLFCLF